MQYLSAYGDEILPVQPSADESRETIGKFASEVPRRLTTLARCVDDNDWIQMGEIAGDLMRESEIGGFPPISRLAFQLEMACRTESDEAGILTALEQLDTALRRVRISPQDDEYTSPRLDLERSLNGR